MTDDAGLPRSTTRGLKHWLGFLGSGSLAFVVDVGVLKLLMIVAGWPPLPSRLVSMCFATVAGWLAHRRFTFAVAAKPSLAEFVKYLGVASTSAVINFAVFAFVLFVRPQTDSALATFVSSGCSMVASYLGMRFGAFRQR